jgi:hypothetical protein
LVPILFALELPAFRQGIRFRPVALRLFDDLESFVFREAVFASEVADLVWLAGSDPPSVRRASLALVICHYFLLEPPLLNSRVARTLRRFDASRREENQAVSEAVTDGTIGRGSRRRLDHPFGRQARF